MDASAIAAAGMISAENRFSASARRTVSGDHDLPTEAVEQISDKTAFQASAAVMRVADEMTKRLLDIKV
jgi:hypothetical protein